MRNCEEVTRQKKRGLEIVGAVNCGKVNIWRKLMEDKDYFRKVCLCIPMTVLTVFSDND